MGTDMLNHKKDSDPIAIWCITPNGCSLGKHLQKSLPGSVLFVSKKLGQVPGKGMGQVSFSRLSIAIQDQFNQFSGHVFVFSTGIAVRMIAPLLRSKTVDPAVVVVDDRANHAISLLSGHLGGANALTREIAGILNAVPVITTATDTNFLPAIDVIAQDQNLTIETPQNIKHVNMAFLTGTRVSVYDPLACLAVTLPKDLWTASGTAAADLCCSHEIQNVSRETLVLRPRVLCVGIGCNRGTSRSQIQAFLLAVFKKEGLSVNSIDQFATTTVKADELGLLALSEEMKIKIKFYDKQELNSVKTIETPSQMVEKHLGVKSVCEAAAILAAGNGKLIVPKKKNKDVTIAVALKP